jgi:mRNA interferase MazF
MPAFVPDAGDLVSLIGRRPALVLSPRSYNQKSGLALLSPITNQIKGYPFEVPLPSGCGASGAILADHVKSVDWGARHGAKIGRIPASTLDEVLAKLAPLLGF